MFKKAGCPDSTDEEAEIMPDEVECEHPGNEGAAETSELVL